MQISFFLKKMCFWKWYIYFLISQDSKFAVECDGKNKIAQNVQNLACSQKNT